MSKKVSIIGVATTYAGTVIGAGYASGQEILQYFLYFKEHTWLIVCLTTLLFFVFGYLPAWLAITLRTNSYIQAINPLNIKFLSLFCDLFITLSLFGTLVIMLSGAGATFEDKFGLPMFVGALVVCILLVINTYIGLNTIVKVMEIVIPIMFLGVAVVGIYSIVNPSNASEQEIANAAVNNSSLIWHWGISAVLYVAFNFQLALAVLVPLSDESKNNSTIFFGILLGAIMLGGCALFLSLVLKAHIVEVGTQRLPMIVLANNMSPFIGSLYAIILFCGLYSTAITCFYGSVERFKKIYKLQRTSSLIVITATALVGFFASLLGFKDLISIVYPLLGYGGIVIMLIILYAYFQVKTKKQ
ncbi:hypothetical protein LS73_000010 [Helicobacter muridarum]|uniref:Uncharacterized membrane protein n=1 Tax=Helicobacter muridarum TaxID=216 RepID=A0A377PU52_9HELI|nr:hypothetical protein [Helicobacter muridarum]TLE01567.1 hypothetical protein LS73_000010 [Helicobacter muridarum]STQ86175.1 Uncharacterized membrane protein [Helicobacter muridarum]